MSVDLIPYALPMHTPFQTARDSFDERWGVLVRLAEGELVGWGDACPVPGWSSHPLEVVLEHLERATLALETEFVDDVLVSLAAVPEARAALAGAVADLLAQRDGLPLAARLDAAPLTRVPVNATIGGGALPSVLDAVGTAVAAGFRTLKCKVGVLDPDNDVARLAAIRAEVGPGVAIRIDANGAWDHATALDVLTRLADLGIALCEEPVRGVEAIAAVGAESPVPVAVDESARTLADVLAAAGSGSIGAVVIKPQALGGPDIAMQAVHAALEQGVAPIVTSMIDSAVGVAHAVHVAAATRADRAHGLATSALLASDVTTPLPVVDGRIAVPTVPGIGVRPAGTDR